MAANELFVGQQFTSFEQFDEFFKQYMQQTQQIFCVGYARTVERHNRLRSKKLDMRLRYAYVKYQCKCAGTERHRGTGIRSVQR